MSQDYVMLLVRKDHLESCAIIQLGRLGSLNAVEGEFYETTIQ